MAEWLAHLPAKQEVCGSIPLAIYTVTPEVSLREGISRSNKAAHSGLETQRRRPQKSQIGVSVAPRMDMCRTKI